MTIQNQNTHSDQQVYFGYNWGSDPMPKPTDSIAYVTQVIRAMNDLIQGYRDPNEWTENPDNDTRAGIRYIFEACATQLDIANEAIEGLNDISPEHMNDSYPRLDNATAERSEPLSFNDWQSAAQWAAHGLNKLPATRQGVQAIADREHWRKHSEISRKRNGVGGGWEYHVSALPRESQEDFKKRKAFFATAYNRKATG